MKTFVISDIHGAHKAFIECIEKSGIDKENDTLIFLGDVCDGWPYVKECIDELMSFKKLIHIIGNHDEWALEWISRDNLNIKMGDYNWISQGGQATVNSLKGSGTDIYRNFLKSAKTYHKQDGMLFMHGGFDDNIELNNQSRRYIMWDRDMIRKAKRKKISNYNTIFVGHTPTIFLEKTTTPINYNNVWEIDTGASYDGPLTIMDVNTKEYFQSSIVKDLYPGITAR